MNLHESTTHAESTRPATTRAGLRATFDRMPPGLFSMIVVVAAFLLVYLGSTGFDPYRTYQVATACAMFCAVAGLSALTGLTGQVSLGHGALMAVGAYTTVLFLRPMIDDGQDPLLSLVVALVAAVVVAALAGLLLGLAGAKLEGPYLAGVTLALVVAVPAVATVFDNVFEGENGLPMPPISAPVSLSASMVLERWQLLYCLVGALVVAFVLSNVIRSHLGRSWRATRDNEIAASLSGVNVGRARVLAFVVSAACAGLGGGLLGTLNGLVAPGGYGLGLSIQLLTAMVIGGLGSLVGAAIGSFIIVWLPTFLAGAIAGWDLSPAVAQRLEGNLPLSIYGVILILVMLLAPKGLAGVARTGIGAISRYRSKEDGDHRLRT